MNYPETDGARAHLCGELLFYTFPIFDAFADRFRAAFSTRRGGVSEGCYSSLNLGINRGDDARRVAENFARFGAAAGFDPARSVLSQQTHSINIRLATSADAGKGLIRERDFTAVDGLVTAEKHLPLLTNYADCTPLLFYAPDRHIAANSHAGWRGTVDDMAGTTVRYLHSLGCDPAQLRVVIGPSAGPCCYEVDEQTAACFAQHTGALGELVRPIADKPGKYLADMWKTNQTLLEKAGVLRKNIALSGLCTICNPDTFYSHRVQDEQRGAMIAMAMLL